MPKANYRFDKRQRELAKQKKKEEKRLRKLARAEEARAADEVAPEPGAPADAERA